MIPRGAYRIHIVWTASRAATGRERVAIAILKLSDEGTVAHGHGSGKGRGHSGSGEAGDSEERTKGGGHFHGSMVKGTAMDPPIRCLYRGPASPCHHTIV